MIPRETLERWKALADAATPGPWYAPDDGYQIVDGNGDYLMTDDNVLCPERADFKFTAAAREAIPALIAEVEEQAKEIDAQSKEIERLSRLLRNAYKEIHDRDERDNQEIER